MNKPTTPEEAAALGYVPAAGGHRMYWYRNLNGTPVTDKMLVLYMRGDDFVELKVPITDAEYADLLTQPARHSRSGE